MKKIFLLTLACSIFLFNTGRSYADERVTNGGFESATAFQGWTFINPTTGYHNWANTTAGQGGDGCAGCSFTFPTTTTVIQGTKNAWNGVTAGSNQSHTLTQDVTIPAGTSASMTWSDRYQMNYTQFCSSNCGTAQYFVEILNTSNIVLQTLYTVTTATNTNTNTGWVNHYVNLGNNYAGLTIRLRFRTLVTASLQGPGQLEIDAVSIQAPGVGPTAADVSIGGRVFSDRGAGLSNTMVTLTDGANISRSVMTNSFGYYNIDGIDGGKTYILTVKNKKYLFTDSPRVFNAQSNLTNMNFRAAP